MLDITVQWKMLFGESVVEGEFIDAKQNSIYVRGSEFIKIGGCPEVLKGNLKHVWGVFEKV